MKSREQRQYTNSLWKAYQDSSAEIEIEWAYRILEVLRGRKEAVPMSALSKMVRLNVKAINDAVRRKPHLFFVDYKDIKNINADNTTVEMTKEGAIFLAAKNL